MNDTDKLIGLLNRKAKLTAMIAPSFPVMYDSKKLISRLRSIGFRNIIEVAVGAKKTNAQAIAILGNNPHTRFITSPCASFVRYMRTKHPDLLHYLAFEVDSPMVATAKIARKNWPDHKPVFIGPCLVKKLEASQDHPELDILVITYRELEEVLAKYMSPSHSTSIRDEFDLKEPSTRTYPLDGGLTDTSGARSLLSDDEIRVVSGWSRCEAAIEEFKTNKKIRLLDILFCDGGCIMGPGIKSSLNLEERKDRIMSYASSL